MISVVLLAATAGLFALPAMMRRKGARLGPAEWTNLNALSLLIGALLLEAALVICALPILRGLVGEEQGRHFFPGGALAGWISLGAALFMAISWTVGLVGAWRRRRRLRVEQWVGSHFDVEGVDVVILPIESDLALAIPGRPGQVVISRALFKALPPDELRVVVRHEIAHVRNHHSRYLLLVAALNPVFGRVPPLRSSLTTLRLSIESWADRDACSTPIERDRARRAILSLSLPDPGPGIAALSAPQSFHERLEILSSDTSRRSAASSRVAIYSAEAALLASALGALLIWWL